MSLTGLLVVSNIKQIEHSIKTIKKYVKNLYIHLNVASLPKIPPPPSWGTVISHLYCRSFCSNPELNLRILVSPIKSSSVLPIIMPIDMLFSDSHYPEICEKIRENFNIERKTIYLHGTEGKITESYDIESHLCFDNNQKVYGTVVLGGTFDRIHIGHKILLSEAVLRAYKRVVVGITDINMIKTKTLPELILPVEQRMQEVRDFLNEIDSSLQYDIIAIQDAFGPTKTDPDMDMIIVSAETLKGGQKVNEIRAKTNLSQLDIFSIDLVESTDLKNGPKESKVSSSNTRIDILGTRIRQKKARPQLAAKPYIIGLTGGMASGKTSIAKKFQELGAYIIDCDKIAHELYEPGQVCYEKIIKQFGLQILDSSKRIDRKKLGSIVFADSQQLDSLNRIMWPEILLEAKRRIEAVRLDFDFKVVMLEAALLLQAGWETECHEVWSIIVPPEESVKRIIARNNLTTEDARNRIANQLINETIVQKSDVIFCSTWGREFTEHQAKKAWHMLMEEMRVTG